MRLAIRHTTRYAYDAPIAYAVQEVRLTPSDHAGQRVLSWAVEGEGRKLSAFTDGYGNLTHLFSVRRMHDAAEIVALGEVETQDTNGVVAGTNEGLPAAFYTRTTRFTEADEDLAALAEAVRDNVADDPVAAMHDLMRLIRERVAFEVGPTGVTTTAAETLAAGHGVCQDFAHIMLACARRLGLPARYVSGYLWTGADVLAEAGHAWAEVSIPCLGWVGFDPANGVSPTDAYVRVGSGLDYAAIAPVRGVRRGIARERLDVEVRVTRLDEGP